MQPMQKSGSAVCSAAHDAVKANACGGTATNAANAPDDGVNAAGNHDGT